MIKKTLFIRSLIIAFVISICAVNAEAASISDLMYYSLEPVGKCLYVYGGGWNEPDIGAGEEAMQKGVSEKWIAFYNANSANYDHKQSKYQIHDGLDCTGYVGWCMYQLFEDTYSKDGYVYLAEDVAKNYSELFGGEYIPVENVSSRKCGDIMSSPDHAYIVVGECSDGSIVLLHASPPAIGLCGTCNLNGDENSEALALANYYMDNFFNECYTRYPDRSKGDYYLTGFDRMSWDGSVLQDPDGYRELSAEEVLKDIFYNTKVYINGERMLKDEPIYEINSSLFVPVRVLSEELGADVTWNDGIIDITQNDIKIVFYDGSDTARVNGEEKKLIGNVFTVDDTAYVPLRFVAETFGKSVDWDSYKKAAYVY